MKLRRRQGEDFNISFLDVICCGFGAIILLLMITKVVEPIVLEDSTRQLEGSVNDLQAQLFKVRGDTKVLNRALIAKREQLSEVKDYVARLQGDKSDIEGEFSATAGKSDAVAILEDKLAAARQRLSAEMQRLLGRNFKRSNELIGGIPVDSEYLVFIIDTSGSMFNYAWPRMQKELIATLDIYPKVKGIQIMNDMGNYMFSNYRGKWIPDTPGRRRAIISRLSSWNPFSNSSPVEGVTNAIRTFYSSDKKISLYVFGDDFTGRSIEEVMTTIDRFNRVDEDGNRLVRIHAVGFPVLFEVQPRSQITVMRFAALMREMTYRNGGTFVGLNGLNE
ncbi:MAG: hypothetical protein ACR2P1_11580 [Pseudomonadales bacterium]